MLEHYLAILIGLGKARGPAYSARPEPPVTPQPDPPVAAGQNESTEWDPCRQGGRYALTAAVLHTAAVGVWLGVVCCRPGRPARPALLGPGTELSVTDATPGTRFLLMTGRPYGEAPIFNGPYMD